APAFCKPSIESSGEVEGMSDSIRALDGDNAYRIGQYRNRAEELRAIARETEASRVPRRE
ncbi:MAG TPA: hypothetical protein VKR31_09355, partial [Rhizomicrobium sp.]|nr:hypothetical protein [Rhizomicrobium sp.]